MPDGQPQDPVEMAGSSVAIPWRPARYLASDRQRTIAAVVCAAIGFAIAWYLIHHGWYRLDTQWDTKEYAKYARNIVVRGLVPYRDFSVEYPPLALPVFVLPRLIAGNHFSGYMVVFGLMMAACGVISAGLAALVLAAQRVSTRQLVCGVALLALSPLLLGAVLWSRYDLFPTMLMVAALAAIYFGWNRSGFVLLALGTAAKAFPVVARADRDRVRVAPPRAARRADLPGGVRRRAARLLPAVPRDRSARGLVGHPRPGEPAAPDRERWRGGVPGGASAGRAAPLVLLHAQLGQPRRSPGAHVRRCHELVPAREPARSCGRSTRSARPPANDC